MRPAYFYQYIAVFTILFHFWIRNRPFCIAFSVVEIMELLVVARNFATAEDFCIQFWSNQELLIELFCGYFENSLKSTFTWHGYNTLKWALICDFQTNKFILIFMMSHFRWRCFNVVQNLRTSIDCWHYMLLVIKSIWKNTNISFHIPLGEVELHSMLLGNIDQSPFATSLT